MGNTTGMEPTQELIDELFREHILRTAQCRRRRNSWQGHDFLTGHVGSRGTAFVVSTPMPPTSRSRRFYSRGWRGGDGWRRANVRRPSNSCRDRGSGGAGNIVHGGGFASTNLYRIPRSREDADFVLEISPESLSQLADHLGPRFLLDPQGSFEAVTMTLRHVLRPVGVSFAIELFHLSDDPYDQEQFRRRRRIVMSGREAARLRPRT